MMTDGVIKMLYSTAEIDGKKIMVFECGLPPLDEYGDPEVQAFVENFSADRNVYYEATDMSVQWLNAPFYKGRTPPSKEELEFQLRKWHEERRTRFIVAAVIAVIVLWFVFK